ncbi:MAG: NucA/NucB deoxyribonuclease domain-containing protein [Phycisphaerales bacterium]
MPNVGRGTRDEYPFASSREGGRGAWVGHVSKREQNAQGAVLTNFFRRHRVGFGDRFRVRIVD